MDLHRIQMHFLENAQVALGFALADAEVEASRDVPAPLDVCVAREAL